MSEQPARPSSTDDDIDLSAVFKAIQNFFKSILVAIVSVIQFYWRKKFILLGLIIVGAVLGYFWDNAVEKTYKNQLLVLPNFESTNYLYNKIESIENKIRAGDTVFLKDVFGKEYESVASAEVLPVVDIYNFVSRNQSNQDLFELLFEEEADMEFLQDPINSRNYEFHNIVLKVKGEKNHEKLSSDLIDYLNNNNYFKSIKEMSLENLKKQLEKNEGMISQIDSIISYSRNQSAIQIEDNQLSFNDNSGLNDLLRMKSELITNQKAINQSLIKQKETVNVLDVNNKIIDNGSLFNKSKVKLLPLIFLLFYSFIVLIFYLSKKIRGLTF